MYNSIENFLSDWAYEAEATLKVFNNLTDESLSRRVTPQGRSLGFLAWHITSSISEMMSHAGMNVVALEENDEAQNSVDAIILAYEKSNNQFIEKLPGFWTDDMLEEEIPMYGEQWKRGFVLHTLLVHQIHHRGQMTVLMRQAGLKPPEIYGPTYEDWSKWNMPPAK